MPARGASGGGAINPQRIQRAARRPAPPIRTVRETHVAPRTIAPARHQAPPPAWRGVPSNPFHAALGRAYAHQQRAERPAPRSIPEGGLIEKGVLPRIEAEHPMMHAYAEQARGRALQQVLRTRAEAEARKRASSGGPLNIPGVVNLTPAVAAIAGSHLLPKGIVGNVLNEVIDLPAQTLLSSAIAGSATRSAVEGKPQALEGVGKSLLSQLEHPVKSLKEAPVSTALLLAGGENVLGRLGGRLARTGALGEKAADLASVARPDLNLYGNEKIVGRTYNPDPLRKAAQVGYEKALPKLPGQLAQEHGPFQASGWRLRRNLVGGVTKVGRVDRIAAASEDTRRAIVKGTVAKIDAAHPGPHADAVALAVQRVLRSPSTAAEDLKGVRDRWVAAQGDLKGSELKANKANVAAVDRILADPHFHDNPEAIFKAAQRVIDLQAPLTVHLLHGGKLEADQLNASLYPYAQAHMGAIPSETGGPPEIPGYGPVTPDIVLEHMAEAGIKPPGYVSHKTGVAGRGSFFKSTLRQPTLERFHRTGAAFAKGTADHSFEALKGTLAKQASEAAQLEVRRRVLNRLGFGGPYKTPAHARLAADQFHATPAGEAIANGPGKVVPVHLGSGQIIERGHIGPLVPSEDVLRQFGLAHHGSEIMAENGHYALIPQKVAKRLEAHDTALSTNSEIGRGLQVYQQAFRRAKLNTSMPHIAGVVQEQAIRLLAEQTGPRARKAGAKFNRNLAELAQLDEHGMIADSHGPLSEAYREMAATFANRGGLAGSQRANDVVRKGDQFAQTSALGYIAHGAQGAARSKAGHAIGAPWRAWKFAVEGGLAKVEHGTRNAMLAKALRDSGIIDSYRHLIGMQDDAVKALIAGKMTPNMADHLAVAIDEMGGNWNRQTPAVRTAISKYAPFGLWWLNSMRWLYRLPVTHPVKTAILAGLYQATREQRNAKGQGYDAAHPVPGFLQGTIDATLPLLGKGKIAPTYYSPGGTLGPEATKTFVDLALPQLSGIEAAAKGQNPLTGNKLTDAEKKELGPLADLLNVGAQTVAGPTPFATQAEKLLTMGGKPYGTANLITDLLSKAGGPSQVKPGTERPLEQVLGKLISPTRFDFPSSKAAAGPATPAEIRQARREAREARAKGVSAKERQEVREAREEARKARR